MTQRVYNFSPGPAVLPLPVLEKIRDEMVCLPGAGASILEISHRSKTFIAIMEQAEANLRSLLAIPEDYAVLFIQGGSRLQFSMVPLNLMTGGRGADYVVTGSWGKYALAEAVKVGSARAAWDGKGTNYDRLPDRGDLKLDPQAAYVHVTSNETIQGVQFPAELDAGGVPLVADLSSDFLSRPIDVARHGLIYACAQKNAGPSGVTVVIVRKDLAGKADADLAGYLNYQNHIENDSMWNTPPTFAAYALKLITDWLINDIGGLKAMHEQNVDKARLLYDVLDKHPKFYVGHAQKDCRSLMNVTFRLPNDELTEKFVAEAKAQNLTELKGHRSVGGIRASIYNAMPPEGVKLLRDFMLDFAEKNAS